MASLREQQKQMTRRLLLESGLRLFVEQGYAATTVDHIAKAAGTTRVTFYAYFPSRADLMKALIDEQLNEVLQRSRSPRHGSTARELVEVVADGTSAAIGAWLRRTSERWPEIRPLLRVAREAAAVDRELGNLVEQWLEEAISDVEDGLAAADRFDPGVRHFKGVLAMAELDFVAQNYEDGTWKVTREEMLDELTASWVRLLGDPD